MVDHTYITARQRYDYYKPLLDPSCLARMTETQKTQLKEAFDSIAKQACHEEYKFYVEYVHEGRWIPTKFHVWLCDKVQEFIERKTTRAYEILLLSVPPQHGKSLTVTETLPSWYLGKNQLKRVIEASYNEDFAQSFGRSNKNKILKFGKQLFDIELAKKPRLDENFKLSNGVGGMISKGITAGITGNPGDLIIIDDPLKTREESDSQAYRDKLWEIWQNVIKTRLSAGAKIIDIQTRWHEDDLFGRILQNEKNVTVINVPCEAEQGDLLGRPVGGSLCPELGKGNEWLDEFKRSFLSDPNGGGQRAWYALFQGRPNIQEGNLIKEIYWNYWKPKGMKLPPVTIKGNDGEIVEKEAIEIPDYLDELCQSWDCAFKDTKKSDYVCGGTWGRRMKNIFLLDLVNERMDIIKTMSSIEAMSKKWQGATLKLIEEKANGAAVIQIMRNKVDGLVPVIPEHSKEARVNAWLPVAESGNIYLPHPLLHPWVREFTNQCKSFPNGTHDDMVDMASQAINRLKNSTRSTDVMSKPVGYRSETELEDMGYKKPVAIKHFKPDSRHRASNPRKAKVI